MGLKLFLCSHHPSGALPLTDPSRRHPVAWSLSRAVQKHSRCAVFSFVVFGILAQLASCEDNPDPEGNPITAWFSNDCNGNLDVFWVSHNGMEEIYQFSLPEGHKNALFTSEGNVFRAKFPENKGLFGEDVVEEKKMEKLKEGPEVQEIRFCSKNEL